MAKMVDDYSLAWLCAFGRVLDRDPHTVELDMSDGCRARLRRTKARTVRDFLIGDLLHIRNKTRGLIEFVPNRAQEEYSRCCTDRNIVLKARQLGMTTYIAARFFIDTITRPGTLTLQVAHDMESAEDIFRIVHRFRENLPGEMRQGALRTSRANVRQIAFPQLDSEYRVATAADEDAGRGTTVHNLHCSEVARWPGDPQETLSSLRAAVPKNGQIVLESTPKGAGGLFYEEWQQAGETGYKKHFFPWWYEDAYQLEPGLPESDPLTEDEKALKEEHGLSLSQIAWRRRMRAQLRGLAIQEYPEDPTSCFRASGECVFDLESIDQALATAGKPVQREDNDRWCVWFPPVRGKCYVIGVDPAGGSIGGDYSCAEVLDRESGLQCAELHGHFTLRELAQRLVKIGSEYNEALLAVEQNNHGHGVLAHLERLEYGNLYGHDGRAGGWETNRLTRPAMIETLSAILSEAPGVFQSKLLLNEFRTFVRHADGSSSAQAGTHDDCVMAMAIAFATREAVAGKQIHNGTRANAAV